MCTIKSGSCWCFLNLNHLTHCKENRIYKLTEAKGWCTMYKKNGSSVHLCMKVTCWSNYWCHFVWLFLSIGPPTYYIIPSNHFLLELSLNCISKIWLAYLVLLYFGYHFIIKFLFKFSNDLKFTCILQLSMSVHITISYWIPVFAFYFEIIVGSFVFLLFRIAKSS